jgi:uncharacterized protein YjiS (DUF1127 family)
MKPTAQFLAWLPNIWATYASIHHWSITMSLVAFFSAIAREMRTQKDINLLRELDDAALKDIGLSRHEIDHLVRQHHGPIAGDTLRSEEARMHLSRSGLPSRPSHHR